MGSNVFDQDLNFLIQAQRALEKRDSMKKKVDATVNEEKRLKKTIQAEEKSIADEINTTIKKQRNELVSKYDKKIDENKSLTKDTKSKREKQKSKQMDKRFAHESAEFNASNKGLKTEIKALFKNEGVPSICNTTLYYALFMPNGLKEFAILILSVLIAFGGLPGIAYLALRFIAFKDSQNVPTLIVVIVTALIIIIVGALYFCAFNMTKLKYRDTLAHARKLRNKMMANDKKIQKIKRNINNDKDESSYDLGEFDSELASLQKKLNVINEKKENALNEFDKRTSKVITDEINTKRSGKLKELEDKLAMVQKDISKQNYDLAAQELTITNQYGDLFGKEGIKPSAIKKLIAIMEDEDAFTIGEAIDIMKGKVRDDEE